MSKLRSAVIGLIKITLWLRKCFFFLSLNYRIGAVWLRCAHQTLGGLRYRHHSSQSKPWADSGYSSISNVSYLMLSKDGDTTRVRSSMMRCRIGSALQDKQGATEMCFNSFSPGVEMLKPPHKSLISTFIQFIKSILASVRPDPCCCSCWLSKEISSSGDFAQKMCRKGMK